MITQKNFHVDTQGDYTQALGAIVTMPAYVKASAVLVQLHSQVWEPHFIKKCITKTRAVLKKALIVGMTNTNNEVYDFEQMFDGAGFKSSVRPDVRINVICFEESTLCLHAFDCTDQSEFLAGGNMGQLLTEETDAKGVLLFAAGAEILTESYLAMATAANAGIPFFGATASIFKRQRFYTSCAPYEDLWKLNKQTQENMVNYVYYDDGSGPVVMERGFVNVVFKGKDLHIRTGYNFGWTPIGKKMPIDSVEGDRIVHTIDGQPASYIYKKYLGLRPDQLISDNICEFPFAIKRGDRYLARMGFRVEGDDEALAFSSPVFEGDELRLTYGNPDTIFSESSMDAEEVIDFQAQALILSACMNRSVLLKEDVSVEHNMYRTVCPNLMILHGNGEILSDEEGGGELASALVSVAFREGERDTASTAATQFRETCPYRNRRSVPLVHRLLTFLSSTSADLEEALTEAWKANEAKNMFLSSISHEIRTPINAVLGLDEMILRESREKDIRRYALDIQNSGRTLLSLINDLLDSSRIDAGKMELVPVEYDLASMLNDLVNMTAVRAEEKGLKLIINVDEDIPHKMYGDDTRLKQCVLNILTNAVKYTREGTVTLDVKAGERHTGEDGDYPGMDITYAVTDTGIGIRKEDIPHLFTAYERIDEARNHGIEGTGLGMNIVTSILDMMGSKLDVKSVYGKGSTFSFTVRQAYVSDDPIGNFTEKYEQSVETAINYAETFHAPDARILVVDDTRMNLTVIRGLLKETQIGIDTAEGGVEALALAAKKPYDVIFLDQRMPEMDGTETLKRLQPLLPIDSEGKKTPVIMLTADAIAGARERFIAAGFDDYLAKPINGRRLERMLLKYLPKDKVELQTVSVDEEEPKKEDYTGHPFLEALSAITGLDVAAGLANCMNEDILKETIADFVIGAKTIPDEIEGYIKAADWENYTIRVHALKSSARIIGASALSELAAFLEKCGDEKNVTEIKERSGELLERYRAIGAALAAAIEGKKPQEADGTQEESGDKEQGDPIDEAQLADAFMGIREMVEAFDYDGAGDILAMVRSFRLSEKQKEKLGELSDLIRRLERDKILELLEKA